MSYSVGAANEPSLPDKVLALDRRLQEIGVEHAFGGALALAYYAEPRSTIDIDVNLFLAPSAYPQVERALASLGVRGEVDPAHVLRDGQCRLWWGRTPVDLFFAYDDLHEAMRREIRREPFGDAVLSVLAPEHLLACKAIFSRPKDWLDIEQVFVCVDDLDVDEVRAWLRRIVGAEDPRYQRFEDVLAAVRG
jgi:hypothetical protein